MKDWHKYWHNYRLININTDEDLLYQTGWTVARKSISKEIFEKEVMRIKSQLKLEETDLLLDLCCGNGVLTYELSKYVKKIIGVDFSEPFIQNAIKYKSSENIEYYLSDIKEIDKLLIRLNIKPNKVLMYGSLAYLKPKDAQNILNKLFSCSNGNMLMFIGSVLDKAEKWKFFNTYSRKWDYVVKQGLLRKNIGLGRWWYKKEFNKLCAQIKLKSDFIVQDESLFTSHYRFDVIISKE